MILFAVLLAFICIVHHSDSFRIPILSTAIPSKSHASTSTAIRVSELHIPGYRESKNHFLLDNDNVNEEMKITQDDYSSLLPFQDGHLIHKTNGYLFTNDECDFMVQEAEELANKMGWTTTRHGVRQLIRVTLENDL